MSAADGSSAPDPVPPAPARGLAAIAVIASDIKLAHSVFALPFALLGAFLAATSPGGPLAPGPEQPPQRWLFGWQLALILVAMVSARTTAMLANRLVDRRIDARNPRTALRAIPSGRLSAGTALAAMLASALVFVACFRFLDGNEWPLSLAVPVLLWIAAYGYLKRFTWLCHFWLGISLGISPIAAALAVSPESLGFLAPWFLGVAVACGVAGFDVIYALQDVEVDKAQRLRSLPASWGVGPAMHASRVLHVASIGLLVCVYLLDPSRSLGRIYVGAVALAAGVLLFDHLTIRREPGPRRIAMVMTLNGLVSLLVGGAGIADLLAG
jgi:4-hydroxybenzoate polyprenyltransferase